VLFNSYEFLFLFLPVTLVGFFAIGKASFRLAAVWLGLASIFFYGFWNPKFVALLIGSIVANFAFGYFISKCRAKFDTRLLLTIAIALNLLLLAYFKYTNFFVGNINAVTGSSIPLQTIVLPLGISFFTFTQIAFLVDVHRGIADELDFINYLLFVSFFPHLIAGPVLHHRQMMPQFRKPSIYRWNSGDVAVGLAIFILGLAKKVLIADNLSEYASPVFGAVAQGQQLQFFEAWAGSLAYALQLYFDFSGYSDMAVGLARMFGIHIPINFNSPYKAGNIIEFWRRWHITLSNFLRDYLYFALGGNRRGPVRRYMNLFITMALGGLWHGANWTFVIWGALHGVLLMANHACHALGLRLDRVRGFWASPLRVLATGITFTLVVIAWVFFRADNVGSALSIVNAMAFGHGVSLPPELANRLPHIPSLLSDAGFFPITRIAGTALMPLLGLGLVIVFFLPNSQELILEPAHMRWERMILRRADGELGLRAGLMLGCILAVSLWSLTRASEFLYFQF
jgi:alginate O-acetyltransferase complex protein AlgI